MSDPIEVDHCVVYYGRIGNVTISTEADVILLSLEGPGCPRFQVCDDEDTAVDIQLDSCTMRKMAEAILSRAGGHDVPVSFGRRRVRTCDADQANDAELPLSLVRGIHIECSGNDTGTIIFVGLGDWTGYKFDTDSLRLAAMEILRQLAA